MKRTAIVVDVRGASLVSLPPIAPNDSRPHRVVSASKRLASC